MTEQYESDDQEAVQRMVREAARVAAATYLDLEEEAHDNGFSVQVYRAVVARLARASTPPGTTWVEFKSSRAEPEAGAEG